MVVDFSTIDFNEPARLVLKNLDGQYIQPLGYAHSLHAKLCYNEMSEITFSLPRYVDNQETPHYNDVVGMRIVDWIGVGQFMLINPKVVSDGLKEEKQCTAYSLEYELTFKNVYLADGTYNLWNPLSPDGTVLGMLLDDLPSWSIGEVDSDLVGKYRTFEVTDDNVYNFLKSTAQDSYNCIFDFNTYERKINVRSVTSLVAIAPIYISLDNLAKEISVTEDTENIFTCLDVNGADDVDIRSVNPMGTNKIYNFDHFMNDTYFSQSFIDKYNAWKTAYDNNKELYFNVTVEKVLEESRLETEKAALSDLQVQLKSLTALQSTYIEANAQGIDRQSELDSVNVDIVSKESEISMKQSTIDSIDALIVSLQSQLEDINDACKFSAYFNSDELVLLNRYIKEGSIQESSFVSKSVASYVASDVSNSSTAIDIAITAANITGVENTSGKTIYTVYGGTISGTLDAKQLTASLIRAAFESSPDGTFVFTGYVGTGSYDNTDFTSGCISSTGSGATYSSDASLNEHGTQLSLAAADSTLYVTQNATAYTARSVAWDLLDYGNEQLLKLSSPKYTFEVSSGNFLACSDFAVFKAQLMLGTKVYLNLDSGSILTPIVIGAEFDMDEPDSLSLMFGDTYSATESSFQLVDLLEKSVSMGKTVSSSKNSYSAFVDSDASTQVKKYMESALDLAKNAVLSSGNQAMQIDDSGITLRKYSDDSHTAYDPFQIKMVNNSIVFTGDNWSSTYMAIGKLSDGSTGIVADSLIGKILAGENLTIESSKQDGGVSVFKLDGAGARLYNSQFDLLSTYTSSGVSLTGQVSLQPSIGLLGGHSSPSSPLYSYDGNGNIDGLMTSDGHTVQFVTDILQDDTLNANFWLDMHGNAYFKGTVYATDGQFTGEVKATSGSFKGDVDAADLKLDGVSISNIFKAVGDGTYDSNGDEGLDYLQIGSITIDGTTGSISFNGSTDLVMTKYSTNKSAADNAWVAEWDTTWTNCEVWVKYSYDGGVNWTSPAMIQGKNGQDGQDGRDGSDGSDANVPNYIKSTYIDASSVSAPLIRGNDIQVLGTFQTLSPYDWTSYGYMGYAEGLNAEGGTTKGVALSNSYNASSGIASGNYVIVTSGGVRMQAGSHRIVVTSNGATYDGTPLSELGGGGTPVAVFG